MGARSVEVDPAELVAPVLEVGVTTLDVFSLPLKRDVEIVGQQIGRQGRIERLTALAQTMDATMR